MAFPGSTFGFWLDEDLTVAFSGILNFVHYTDLSDNPQDNLLYFGSPAADMKLEATSSPGVDDITLTPTNTAPEWEATTAYSLGDMVIPTTPNGYIYRCVSAGTSDSSEPSWPTVGLGTTVVDDGVIWALYATHHPATEIKLSLTEGGLDGATGGSPLAVAPMIESGTANAVEIWIRVTNTVQTTSNNTGNSEIGVSINSVVEAGV